MKRLGSSDYLGALISICPTTTTDELSPRNNHGYNRDFRSMLDGLDEDGCIEESGHVSEKKRRLSVVQVKALEKNFEVENMLEPERKVKLAQVLGLQPRQVAVWFQNRRARWKTKQLVRDYGVLKANYDSLKISFESLQQDNQALHKEIKELKAKLKDEDTERNHSVVKDEQMAIANESGYNVVTEHIKPQSSPETSAPISESKELNFESFNNINSNGTVGVEVSLFPDFKDGSSDSDSSAILNEDQNSPNGDTFLHHQLMPASDSLKFNTCSASSSSPSSASMKCFEFQKSSSYQPQFAKIEEHNFFSSDEACNFFSDEQAPSLQWYSPDQWN